MTDTGMKVWREAHGVFCYGPANHQAAAAVITAAMAEDKARIAELEKVLEPFAALADEARDSASPLQNDRDDFCVTQIGGYKIGELMLDDFERARTTLEARNVTDA